MDVTKSQSVAYGDYRAGLGAHPSELLNWWQNVHRTLLQDKVPGVLRPGLVVRGGQRVSRAVYDATSNALSRYKWLEAQPGISVMSKKGRSVYFLATLGRAQELARETGWDFALWGYDPSRGLHRSAAGAVVRDAAVPVWQLDMRASRRGVQVEGRMALRSLIAEGRGLLEGIDQAAKSSGWVRQGRGVYRGSGDSELVVLKRGGKWFVEVGGKLHFGVGANANFLTSGDGTRIFRSREDAEDAAARFMTDNPVVQPKPPPIQHVQGTPFRRERSPLDALKPAQRKLLDQTARDKGLDLLKLYDAARMFQHDNGMSWPKAVVAAAGFMQRRPELF